MKLLPPEPKLLRTSGIVLLALAILAFVFQAWWIMRGDPQPGWFSDSLDYLVFADFFGESFSGNPSPMSVEFFGISRFPPLFPLVLALGGAGTENWTAGYWIALVTGLLSLISTFLWLRQQSGQVFVAAALLPLAALSPQYFLLHIDILSESQFVLLLTSVLWLATRYQQGKCSLLLLVIIAGLVPLSRVAGIALLAALTVWLFRQKQGATTAKRLLGCILMWLPSAAWIGYRRLLPISHDYLAEFSPPGALGAATWSSIFSVEQATRLLAGFSAWFDLEGGTIAQTIAAMILVLAACGWWRRFKDRNLDALFLPVYLGLVAMWPYPNETARLVAVSMPLVALCSWQGLATLSARIHVGTGQCGNTAASAGALMAACLIAAGSTWVDIARRASAQLDPALDSARRTRAYFLVPANRAPLVAEVMTRYVELVKETPNVVSGQDCVWTPFRSATAFFSKFKLSLGLSPAGIHDQESARQTLSACRYVLVVDLVSPQGATKALYPLKYVESFSRPVLLSEINDQGRQRVAAALLDTRYDNQSNGESVAH